MPIAPREMLIALNVTDTVPRPVLCRLGQEPDLWARPLSKTEITTWADRLQVPRPHLEAAQRLRPRAAALAADEERKAAALGAALVVRGEPDYPPALANLGLPPPVLAIRGRLPAGPGIAIVGSRRADPYGLEVASSFARDLAAAGLTVVSGFAHGVDAAAHRGALALQNGRTVAVLGCGHGVDYPGGHRTLGAQIAGGGAVVSEFACGSPPAPWNFPVRNRIIAALSEGTLVVQAAPRSGSLVTARLALELGREVFAVPGTIFNERSLGPNTLIRDGAHLVQHPKDVLENLPAAVRDLLAQVPAVQEASRASASGLPGEILERLTPGEPVAPEVIAERVSASLDRVLGALLELELMGLVRRHPGPAYGRCA